MSRQGLVYVPASASHPLRNAAIGAVVANKDRAPPWIVVDHELTSVIVTRWPGRLLRVEVLDDVGTEGLVPDAGYTRAVAVRVLADLAPTQLFGPQGATVAAVIERGQQLSLADAQALADADDPDAPRSYTAAWNTWLVAEDRGDSIHAGEDHDGTLLIPERRRAGSPIGAGFSVVHRELRERAIAVAGAAATITDEDGETCLAKPWSRAATALLHAAMALGAPQLVPEADRVRLLRAWQHLTAV